MIQSAKTIVAFERNKLIVTLFTSETPSLVEKKQEYEWNDSNLAEVFMLVRKEFGSSVHVLLSDEYTHVITVKVSVTNPPTVELIKKLVQEHIIEDLEKTSWHYTISAQYMYVTVVRKAVYDQITTASERAELTVESMESYSTALAKLFAGEKDPIVILYKGASIFMVTVQTGLPLYSQALPENVPISLERAIIFSQDRFNIHIKKIVYTQNLTVDSFITEFLRSIPTETKLLDPASAITVQPETKPDKKASPIPRAGVFIFFLAFLVTATSALVAQRLITQPNTSSEARVISVSKPVIPTVVIPTTSPTPESLDIQGPYTMIILNGSDVAGEATRLGNQLKQNNYNVILTDNTEHAAAGIHIQYNKRVQQSYLNSLERLLKNLYTEVESEQKLASDEADITLTIGTFVKK